jgi:hypothetical protein
MTLRPYGVAAWGVHGFCSFLPSLWRKASCFCFTVGDMGHISGSKLQRLKVRWYEPEPSMHLALCHQATQKGLRTHLDSGASAFSSWGDVNGELLFSPLSP